ncbi:MAG: glutathione S-transferase [Pseudomonadota bacterium]
MTAQTLSVPLRLEDCVNATCPWSGKPVSADGLTLYLGQVLGFCNPGCRDKFEAATKHFDAAIASVDKGKA